MKKKVVYYAINLPRSTERKAHVEAEAGKAGINLEIVSAVAGSELTSEQRSKYNSSRREALYTRHLSDNEQACVLSHTRCLQRIVESGADYGAVLEDDVTLPENFLEIVAFLTERLGGWECCKLYSIPGKIYPLIPHVPGAPVQPMFPKKIPWSSIGYLYSRCAAAQILQHLDSFFLPWDLLVTQIMLDENIPLIGVTPNAVGTLYPGNEQSDIQSGSPAPPTSARRGRTLRQYVAYRLDVIRRAMGKTRMRRRMRRRLHLID